MESYKETYYVIYALAAIAAVFFSLEAVVKKNESRVIGSFFLIFFLIAFFILFGFRTEQVGTDTPMYIFNYQHYRQLEFGTDYTVKYLTFFLHRFSSNPQIFLLVVAFIYLLLIFLIIRNFNKRYSDSNVFLLGFSFFSLFFFESLGINIIRQGVALMFFLLFYTIYINKMKITLPMILVAVIGIGFHMTSVILYLVFVLLLILKDKISLIYFNILYVLGIILAFFEIGVNSLGSAAYIFVDSRRLAYLTGEIPHADFKVGFKPQFALFNTVFWLFFNYLYSRNKNDLSYNILLKLYIVMSFIFFMMFQIPFSDRWGVMSWVLIPFLASPFLDTKSKKSPLTTFVAFIFMIFLFVFFQNI